MEPETEAEKWKPTVMEVEGGDAVEADADVGADRGRSGDDSVVAVGEGSKRSGRSRVKGPWSPEQDAVLSELVSKFGARNWSLIARGIAGRSGKSCRLRWCNQLDPAVKRKPFTGIFYIRKLIIILIDISDVSSTEFFSFFKYNVELMVSHQLW